MPFSSGDRVTVRPAVDHAYIPDPDHGNAILATGIDVLWSPYWEAMLRQGNILAVASGTATVATAPLLYTQAQLDAAVAAAIAPLQAQIATLTPANILHSTFAAFGLLGVATN